MMSEFHGELQNVLGKLENATRGATEKLMAPGGVNTTKWEAMESLVFDLHEGHLALVRLCAALVKPDLTLEPSITLEQIGGLLWETSHKFFTSREGQVLCAFCSPYTTSTEWRENQWRELSVEESWQQVCGNCGREYEHPHGDYSPTDLALIEATFSWYFYFLHNSKRVLCRACLHSFADQLRDQGEDWTPLSVCRDHSLTLGSRCSECGKEYKGPPPDWKHPF